MAKRKNRAMWVVRSSSKDAELFPTEPNYDEVYEGWFGPNRTYGAVVCYKHWLTATGLSLKKDQPVQVVFTTKMVK